MYFQCVEIDQVTVEIEDEKTYENLSSTLLVLLSTLFVKTHQNYGNSIHTILND